MGAEQSNCSNAADGDGAGSGSIPASRIPQRPGDAALPLTQGWMQGDGAPHCSSRYSSITTWATPQHGDTPKLTSALIHGVAPHGAGP